jgi:shikimate kinase
MTEMNNIYLTGMMGCGKSTVGGLLAECAGRAFVDTDKEIEKELRMPVPRIFGELGEAAFRTAEREALRRAARLDGAVVSCGGGIVLDPENVRLMRRTGRIVYLDRNVERIAASVDTENRPLLREAGDLRRVFDDRRELYQAACDHRLNNDGTAREAVDGIRRLLEL